MRESLWSRLTTKHGLFSLGFIFLLSYFTYFHNYANPQAFYWDENYHIASAQKYLNNTFFMEQHPPLGKMLIAAGEGLLDRNDRDDQFVGTDYGKDPPEGFSFTGYRFFPALMGWFTAVVVFLIFLLITEHYFYATILSFLYVFDNALIVHQRGAMLESPLMFFSAATLLFFLLLFIEDVARTKRWHTILLAIGLGVAFALTATTKVTGLIFLLLFPPLIWRHWLNRKKLLTIFGASALAFVVAYCGVWQIHFAMGTEINKELSNEGYYDSSDEYKQILKDGRTGSLAAFPIMLRDSIRFVTQYNEGVPRLDLCKSDENGSPFFFWPLGARSINYRWETPDSVAYRYLYLQANPATWLLGLLGVIVSAMLLLASVTLPLKEKLPNRALLAVMLGLYVAYMLAMSQIDRVMYLYHYFTPLLFSYVLVGIVFMTIKRLGKWTLNEDRRTLGLIVVGGVIFFAYQFYRPLTYYEPLTDEQFQRRMIFPLWELRCVNCEYESMLVEKRYDP